MFTNKVGESKMCGTLCQTYASPFISTDAPQALVKVMWRAKWGVTIYGMKVIANLQWFA